MICVFKCPFCGDQMIYDNENHVLICNTCNQRMEMEDYDYSYLSYDDSQPISEELTGCSCPTCGSKIIVDRIQTAVTCSYCGSSMAVYGLSKGELSPEMIIPFKLGHDEAFGKLLTWWESKKTMPKFNLDKLELKLSELYVPVWLFDAEVYTSMDARVAPFEISKEDVGPDTIIYDIHKGISCSYCRVPVDGSARISDEKFNGIEPFNYGELEPFNPGYLSGHKAERYYHSQYAIVPEIVDKLKKYGIDQCKSYIEADKTGGPIIDCTVTDSEVVPGKVVYALVPVWVCSYTYNGTKHQVFINGQTGKVDGKVLMAGHKFEKELGIYALSSLFCNMAIAIFFLTVLFGGTGIRGVTDRVFFFYIFIVIIECVKMPSLASAQSGTKGYDINKNAKIHINNEVQYRQGQKYRFLPKVIGRFAVGLLIIGFILIAKGKDIGAILSMEENYLSISLGFLVSVADIVMYGLRRKKFLKRRQVVDYFEYVKAAGVREEPTRVIR